MKTRPVFGSRPFGKRDARLLLVAYFDPDGIGTIPQSIEAWQSLSRHEVVLMNLWPGRAGTVRLPRSLDLTSFEGVIIHPTISYSPVVLAGLDELLGAKGLSAFDGVKVLMKQDEHVLSGRLPLLVRDKRFDVVLSCVAPAEQEKVYPRDIIGACTVRNVLTGYIPASMRQGMPNGPRDLHLSYRGSIQQLSLGRLGYEKRGVGYAVGAALAGHPDILFDISSRWEDRISGVAWDAFLARSRIVLGVESGSNIFDYDGAVSHWCDAYDARHDGEDRLSHAYYARADEEFLHTVEGNVDYAQISPRHFEAAAAGAAQLLYEGKYSGIFHAGEHFFSLRRDLANFDAALDFMRDERAQRRMAERAFEEIILDPRNWYEAFIETADAIIDAKLIEKGRKPLAAKTAPPRPVAFLLAAREPTVDTRLERLALALAPTHDVVVFAVLDAEDLYSRPQTDAWSPGVTVVRLDRTAHGAAWLPSAGDLRAGGPSVARGLLAALVGYAAAPDAVLRRLLGADVAEATELMRFRTLCVRMVDTNAALLDAIDRSGVPDIVVAADLDTLFAATAFGAGDGPRVVFDAGGRWADSVADFQHWEIDFWSAMEGRLAAMADLRIAATPGLARRMAEDCGVAFHGPPDAGALAVGATSDPLPATVLSEIVGFASRASRDALDLRWTEGRATAGQGSLQAFAVPHSVLGGLAGGAVDVADARHGASIRAASRFYPRPHDADSILRPAEVGGYAAARPGRRKPQRIEIDLGRRRVIQAVEIGWYAADSYAVDYRVLVKGTAWGRWMAAVEVSGNRAVDVRHAIHARGVRYLRLEASRFHGDPRLLIRYLRAMEAAQPVSGGASRAVSALNLATEEAGARVVASSPFFPPPNDARRILAAADGGTGYAAALGDAPSPHWVEIDLGAQRRIDRFEIDWFDADNLASAYAIFGRLNASEEWKPLVAEKVNDAARVAHDVAPSALRFLRLEATAFRGQNRLLIRSFGALASERQAKGWLWTPRRS